MGQPTCKDWTIRAFLSVTITFLSVSVVAQQSPRAGQHPTRVYWGDTHLHTSMSSIDAYLLGDRLSPDAAFRFAKGEEVVDSNGAKVRLRRPLDFLMVADHSENLGVMARLEAKDPAIL